MALEADAVLHTGFGTHVEVPEERLRKARRSRRERIKLFGAVLLGVVIGIVIS